MPNKNVKSPGTVTPESSVLARALGLVNARVIWHEYSIPVDTVFSASLFLKEKPFLTFKAHTQERALMTLKYSSGPNVLCRHAR